jgi:hypothetical protein
MAFASASASAGGPYVNFKIGQDNTGTIVIRGDAGVLAGETCIDLAPAGGPFGSGGLWDGYLVSQNPGWESVLVNDPPNNVFRLPAIHRTALVRVLAPSYFSMFTEDAVTHILTADDDQYLFPTNALGEFSEDLYFAVAPGTPAGTTFYADFQLTDGDPGEGMDPTDIFSLCFNVVPEPTTGGLLAVGLMWLRRMRLR